jgi:hypothetical protein
MAKIQNSIPRRHPEEEGRKLREPFDAGDRYVD